MVDMIQAILTGFFTGIGVGLANWLLIRRLENIEKRIQEKMNGIKDKGKKQKEK